MSLRINTRPRRQNSHKADADRRCPAHLQWLRGRPCLLAGPFCSGKIEYHRGAKTFEARFAIDLVDAAGVYAFRSPHRFKHQQRAAQAVRS